MKGILLALLVCAAEAHIIFEHAPLSCDPILPAFQGCLRGQRCSRHGKCESSHRPEDEIQPPQSDSTAEITQRDSEVEYAPGKCRGDAGEGEAGIAADCFMKHPSHLIDEDDVTQKAARPHLRRPFWRPPFRPKPKVSITGTNRIKLPTPTASATPTSTSTSTGQPQPQLPKPSMPSGPLGNVTTDGTCGSTHGDTVCGNWFYGSCCSAYGFCGNSTAHCGLGCQSGPCINGPALIPIAPLSYHPFKIPGTFTTVGRSGVPAMMAILMPNGKVAFADKIENYTELILPNGQFAYSSEYDPVTNDVVALEYKTNAFCAGGTVLADGRALSVGGNGPLNFIDPTVKDGFKGIRYLERKFDDPKAEEGWIEPGHSLSSARWYPSVQTMPDGRIFVASGSLNGLNPTNSDNNNPTYELLDRDGFPHGNSVVMSILEKNQPYYMYPFLHLLKDGNLFVFVSKSSQIFNVETDTIVKTLPDLRGDFRTYPNTGGSVMFPLSSANGWEPEIMICGGGAYPDINSPTDASCGRIKPLSENPTWEVESMPSERVMVEGTLLPDGTIIWLNGCSRGAQGFGIAKDPVYDPWIYNPHASNLERWAVGGSSTIARMYHSVALLLLDGTVMVAGSNPVEQPVLVPNPKDPKTAYVTEFRVEIYTPHYLSGKKATQRPFDVVLSNRHLVANGGAFTVKFNIHKDAIDLHVVLYQGGFVTHSLHMGHRMLYLDYTGWKAGEAEQTVEVAMPPDSNIAPPGAYVIYIVVDGVPSMGQFVMVDNPAPAGDKPKEGDKLNGKDTEVQEKQDQQLDEAKANKTVEEGNGMPKNGTEKDDKKGKDKDKQGTDDGKKGKEKENGEEKDEEEEDEVEEED
ncbi:glyoxal oxidase [Nannizzia gypsea CBS 118893]|uniref:Glyoxal oxidase n=1 Tax=Arthroderma gypseum (strain ATCC MYA-4604 / CBS 118893) TaxID=535722 RepID=E4UW10_ARTGP|nr:glyoxal oxidase [Nannizzia gypsea CBS 118893]EFR02458.1 glyoxal oxidase [Nannizzia gypsea CBS 118893]